MLPGAVPLLDMRNPFVLQSPITQFAWEYGIVIMICCPDVRASSKKSGDVALAKAIIVGCAESTEVDGVPTWKKHHKHHGIPNTTAHHTNKPPRTVSTPPCEDVSYGTSKPSQPFLPLLNVNSHPHKGWHCPKPDTAVSTSSRC